MVGLTTAILYAEQRRQFGPPGAETPILDYVTHQVRLMPLLATTYAHLFISERALSDHVAAQDDMALMKRFHVIISGLKAVASWHGSETLQTCREACGGQGFKSSNRIGSLKADGDIQLTYEGDNYVLLQQVSRALLRGSATNESRVQLAGLKTDEEVKNRCDSAYLRCPDAQLRAFTLRESDLCARLNEEYAAAKSSGMNPGDAFQTCAVLAAEAGRAHVENVVLAEFVARERAAENSLKGPLGMLRSLYALARMDGSASFLRGQYFGKEKAVMVGKEMVRLCGEVREVAPQLVRAFRIPDFLLGEIAGDYVAANAYDAVDRP